MASDRVEIPREVVLAIRDVFRALHIRRVGREVKLAPLATFQNIGGVPLASPLYSRDDELVAAMRVIEQYDQHSGLLTPK